jgi:hypothetical protein
VKNSGNRVRVQADLDSDSAANRMADDAQFTLALAGYAVTEIDRDAAAFYVEAR